MVSVVENEKRKTKGSPDSVDVHVGQRLRVRRSLLGMSQEKLAEAIGLTFQQIQKYERGMNRISAGRLYQFSRVLEVPISYFFESFGLVANAPGVKYGVSDNEQDDFSSSEDVMNNKETLDLIRAYYAIKSPKMRRDVLKFMKAMTEGSDEKIVK